MFMVTVLASGTWAGVGNTNQVPEQIRLEIELVDGSRVIGVPSIESVPIQTPYAKMTIALSQIQTLVMDANHETVSLELLNGDKMKGVVDFKPIGMQTVFGGVTIGIGHVRRIDVGLVGELSAPQYPLFDDGKAGVMRSTTWILVARHNNRVLDVGRADAHDPSKPTAFRDNVLVSEYQAGKIQRWRIEKLPEGCYRLTALHNGKVLTVERQVGDDAGKVSSRPDNVVALTWCGEESQKWTVDRLPDGGYRLTSKCNAKVLDVGCEDVHDPSKPNSDLDNVLVFGWHGGQNQQWNIVRADHYANRDSQHGIAP